MSVKYNIENYIYFDEELGIYDYLHSSKFINELKALDFEKAEIKGNKEVDELSLDMYGTEVLWWVIAIYNDIIDVSNLSSETTLYVPSKSSLEKLFLNYQDV